MSLSEKDIKKETDRKREVEKELKKKVVGFLQERLLCDKPYCTKKEIEYDFEKAGFWIKEIVIFSNEKWLYNFLNKKFSIKAVHYKGEEYYKYKYKWWAKICSIFRK